MDDEREIKVSDSIEDLLGISKEDRSTEESKNSKDKSEQTVSVIALGEDDIIKESKKNKESLEGSVSNNSIKHYTFLECPPPFSQIRITQKAFEDLIITSQAINELAEEKWGADAKKLEVYMYLFSPKVDLGKRENQDPLEITHVYIPPHNAAETNVYVDPHAILAIRRYMDENNLVLVGWAHSHGHFKVYSSKTDDENHKKLLHETSNYTYFPMDPPLKLKYIYGITVNDTYERHGVILTQFPCGNIQERVDKEFIISGNNYDVEERKKKYLEIKDYINSNVRLIKPLDKKSQQEMIEELSQELINTFLKNLDYAKDNLYDSLSPEYDQSFKIIKDTLFQYDGLLVDSIEQSFKEISKKLYTSFKEINNGI